MRVVASVFDRCRHDGASMVWQHGMECGNIGHHPRQELDFAILDTVNLANKVSSKLLDIINLITTAVKSITRESDTVRVHKGATHNGPDLWGAKGIAGN